jgi:hypothetical protein
MQKEAITVLAGKKGWGGWSVCVVCVSTSVCVYVPVCMGLCVSVVHVCVCLCQHVCSSVCVSVHLCARI